MCEYDPTYANQSEISLHHQTTRGRTKAFCDPCIAPLVQALNDSGLQTMASCCGHGHQPSSVALEDGRWVLVVDFETAQSVWQRFPDIHGGNSHIQRANALADMAAYDAPEIMGERDKKAVAAGVVRAALDLLHDPDTLLEMKGHGPSCKCELHKLADAVDSYLAEAENG